MWEDCDLVRPLQSLRCQNLLMLRYPSALIIEQLRKELDAQAASERPPAFTLAFFYFRVTSNPDKQNNLRALMCSLIFQIARTSPKCWKYMSAEYAGPRGQLPRTTEQLFAMLEYMLKIVGSTFIIIDALDECYSSDPRSLHTQKDMLEFLTYIQKLNLPTLHLLVTSRPESSILHSLKTFHPTELRLSETKEHRDDIATYVQAHLPTSEPWDDTMREKATVALNDMQKSQGMYEQLLSHVYSTNGKHNTHIFSESAAGFYGCHCRFGVLNA